MEKTCAKCKQKKPLEMFHKRTTSSDGRQSWCKQCRCTDLNAIVRQKQYRKSENGLIINRVSRKKYKEKYKTKHLAHKSTQRAIASGKLTRQPCCICGDTKVQAHHDDYTKRLSVVWLCIKCHTIKHNGTYKGLTNITRG